MKLDLEKAFTFVFKDNSWANKLIAGAGIVISMYLIFLIPILVYVFSSSIVMLVISFFLTFALSMFLSCAISGFVAETANKRINYRNSLLPDWSEFGRLFISGLKYFTGYFLYSVPVIILASIFIVLLTFYLGQGIGAGSLYNATTFFAMVLLGSIFLFLMILYSVFCPLMMANFYKDLKIVSFIDFKSAFAMLKGNGSNYFVMILIFIAFSLLLQAICSFLVVSVVGVILIPLLYFYLYLVVAEVIAQFVIATRED